VLSRGNNASAFDDILLSDVPASLAGQVQQRIASRQALAPKQQEEATNQCGIMKSQAKQCNARVCTIPAHTRFYSEA
jgi:hypothetical protein